MRNPFFPTGLSFTTDINIEYDKILKREYGEKSGHHSFKTFTESDIRV
jgi:hypothetical protein